MMSRHQRAYLKRQIHRRTLQLEGEPKGRPEPSLNTGFTYLSIPGRRLQAVRQLSTYDEVVA